MGISDQSRDIAFVEHRIHSLFVYAACTVDGFVKVGISGAPVSRLYQVHCGSPSPLGAAQWAWVGSAPMAREIERRVRAEWSTRHTRGEWYRFDYSKPEDKRDFHDTLCAIFEVVTGDKPEWKRLGPGEIGELIRSGEAEDAEKSERKRKPKRPWDDSLRRR